MSTKKLLLCVGVLATVLYSGHDLAAAKKKNDLAAETKADPAQILLTVPGPANFDEAVFASPPDVS